MRNVVLVALGAVVVAAGAGSALGLLVSADIVASGGGVVSVAA